MKNVTAIILAAGLGTRMKSDIPKVLHSVGSKTLLERVIASIERTGIKDVVVVLGYKAEEIEKLFKGRIRSVRQNRLLGSGDALKQALKKSGGIKDNILVTCGDAPLIKSGTFVKLVRTHLRNKCSCTLLTSLAGEPGSYGRIVRGDGGNVTGIVEEKDADPEEKRIKEVNAGTYCFRKKDIIAGINRITVNKKKKELYLTDIIKIFTDGKKTVHAVKCDFNEIMGINARKDLAKAEKTLKMKTLKKIMDSGVTVTDPDTTFIAETARIGKDSVILPCTVIEDNVKIGKSCRIGPFARLRPGTVLEDDVEIGNFVETVRTRIGSGTRVKHHTYLGDTKVGKNVNIGAGTITANYDGRNKNRTVIEDCAFIGVGVSLIAPVRIGRKAKIGAGSVVTKGKNVPAGRTVAGVPARIFIKKK